MTPSKWLTWPPETLETEKGPHVEAPRPPTPNTPAGRLSKFQRTPEGQNIEAPKHYTLDSIDWTDPYLKNIGPLNTEPEPEAQTKKPSWEWRGARYRWQRVCHMGFCDPYVESSMGHLCSQCYPFSNGGRQGRLLYVDGECTATRHAAEHMLGALRGEARRPRGPMKSQESRCRQ